MNRMHHFSILSVTISIEFMMKNAYIIFIFTTALNQVSKSNKCVRSENRRVKLSDENEKVANVKLKQACCDLTHIDLHFSVKSIVEEEVVRHADSVGFHGMTLAVVIVSHITCTTKHKNNP